MTDKIIFGDTPSVGVGNCEAGKLYWLAAIASTTHAGS
jgi:hypothetical protein